MRVVMIFNFPLNWSLLLPIFMYDVVAQPLVTTGSNFGFTSTMTDDDTTQTKVQGRPSRKCSSDADRCESVGNAITTNYDVTTRELNLTQITQTRFNFVGRETVVNAHSSVKETPSSFVEVDVTTDTNKMATVLTQIPIHGSQNNTTLFSGNDSDITRANNLSTDIYKNNTTDIRRLLRNNSWDLDPQSNATHSVTVRTLGNTTILLVEEDYWQERLSVTLFSWVAPFLIIIGTVGNAVSVITFQHRHFRSSSTGFILTALSTVDIAVLNTTLMHYWLLSAFGISVPDLTRFSCKISLMLGYYLHQLSSWNLIPLTVERSISVWFPLRCKELCSKRRIVIAWVIIAIILLAENSFIFIAFDLLPITVGLDDNNITKIEYSCTVNDYWSHLVFGEWAILDAVMGDFFPFLVILIGNILTITRILKSNWERKKQMGAASTSKPMASTTVMLIGISVMFLILNLPFDGTFLYYVNTEMNSLQKEEKAIYDLAFSVGTLSYIFNNAFEFVVYFVSGGKFREAFLETFLPCRKTNNQNVQRTNNSRRTDTRVTSPEM